MQNYGMPIDSEIDSKKIEKTKRNHKHRKLQRSQNNKIKKHKKKNHHKGGAILSESSDSEFSDSNDIKNRPNGGFPNIIMCSPDSDSDNIDKEKVSRREISADKAILSISQILKSRRNF